MNSTETTIYEANDELILLFIFFGLCSNFFKFFWFLWYKTKQVSELQYELYLGIFGSVDLVIVLHLLFYTILGMTWSTASTVFFVLWGVTALPFYDQFLKRDTPYKKFRIEREKLKEQYESVLRENVLLKEIEEKQQNLSKKFEV